MSTYCEIVEDLVLGESTCPATDVILVQPTGGVGSSAALLGFSPPLATELAQASSQVSPYAYAVLIGAASSVSTAGTTIRIDMLGSSTARGNSAVIAAFNEALVSVSAASSYSPDMYAETVLAASAAATNLLVASSHASMLLASIASSVSAANPGQQAVVTGSAVGSNVVTLLRTVFATADTGAEAAAYAFASDVPQPLVLISGCRASSSTDSQLVANSYAAEVADITSDVWFKDPGRVAWVLNTETTAVGWYDNFDFESIAQTPDKVLGVGPDGLYELIGATDSGEQIEAQVVGGFADFGLPQTKRVENMYFGYTSGGRISITVETYESDHPPATYFLEQREADSPRNSRATPGKGLWGRYWRFTIRNVDGADFEVHDASVDIAVSSRRV